jgi:hypothetical protein
VVRTQSGGFQDQARMGNFVWLSGSFGLLAPVVPVLGYHGWPLCFNVLSLILGFAFSVELGLRPCSLRIRLEGLAGGSCLFLSMVDC